MKAFPSRTLNGHCCCHRIYVNITLSVYDKYFAHLTKLRIITSMLNSSTCQAMYYVAAT